MKRAQRGAALLLALWATVLLAALLVALAAAARSHSEAALYGSEQVRAHLAAEAGIARAVAGLRAPGATQRWIPDGRPYAFDFDGTHVAVQIVDVSGLVDLNAAGPRLLSGLIGASGAGAAEAERLAQAIVAARTPAAGGMSAPTPARPWRAVEQLAQLEGMTPELYAELAPTLTVYSGRNFPDASYVGARGLAALRGEPLAQARGEVEARRQRPAGAVSGNGIAAGSIAGGALVAGYGGTLVRVFAVAKLPDGGEARLDATLRMALTPTSRRPYKVLAWRADSVRGDND